MLNVKGGCSRNPPSSPPRPGSFGEVGIPGRNPCLYAEPSSYRHKPAGQPFLVHKMVPHT